MKVLFICTGNTCRSPMAAALLKQEVSNIQVQSAGVHAVRNQPANSNAIKVLEDIGIFHQHASQLVTEELLDWADVVLTMTTQHKDLLMMQYPDQGEKYFTLKEYALDLDLSVKSGDISDPFGGSVVIYEETLQEIKKYIQLIIEKHS